MWALSLVLGCTGSSPTQGTTTDGPSTPPVTATGDTGSLAGVRPIELRGKALFTRLGASLAWLPTTPPLLAVGQPGNNVPEDQRGRDVWFVDPLLQPPDAYVTGPTKLTALPVLEDDYLNDILNHFSTQILLPGDLTGNGEQDAIGFGTNDALGPGAFLFEGPMLARALHVSYDHGIPIEGDLPWRGAPCDANHDGAPDLCTAVGIAYGPITGPVTGYDVTWSAAVPGEDVRLVSADSGGLFLSDSSTARVHQLDTLPPGDHDLSAIAIATWTAPDTPTVLAAGGDLDGDGQPDLVVAWGGTSPRLAIATPTGGDLGAATTTLEVDAWSLAIDDLDGDGKVDLVVGLEGAVWIFMGPLPAGSLTQADADNQLVGHFSPTDDFGLAVLTADMDGDGDAELAVGAPKSPSGTQETLDQGRVYVFHDPATFSWDAFDPPLEPLPEEEETGKPI